MSSPIRERAWRPSPVTRLLDALCLSAVEDHTVFCGLSGRMNETWDVDLDVPVVVAGEEYIPSPAEAAALAGAREAGRYLVRVWRARTWRGSRGYWIRREWASEPGYSAGWREEYFCHVLPVDGEGVVCSPDGE